MTEPIPMRRGHQALPHNACLEVLQRGTAGVLALNDPERGVPYQVPLSYGYHDGTLVFHGARAGHKIELLGADPGAGVTASFTVIDRDDVQPELYTTWYRSVVCTGTLCLVSDEQQAREELLFMSERFWPGHPDQSKKEIERFFAQTGVLVLAIETMVGKEGEEYARRRREGRL